MMFLLLFWNEGVYAGPDLPLYLQGGRNDGTFVEQMTAEAKGSHGVDMPPTFKPAPEIHTTYPLLGKSPQDNHSLRFAGKRRISGDVNYTKGRYYRRAFCPKFTDFFCFFYPPKRGMPSVPDSMPSVRFPVKMYVIFPSFPCFCFLKKNRKTKENILR